jgi:alkylation response protein AidB-like acyl-CoA dehydrogenase
MFIEAEQARSIVLRALGALDGDGTERGRLASAAKVRVAQAGRYVTAQSIQLHGGIGITEEHDAHLFLKRAHLAAQWFGGERELLDEIAGLAA